MMSSYSGYLTYLEYVAGSSKGQTEVGDIFNSPFGLAPVDQKYTSSQVEENRTTTSANEVVTLGWGPVIPGTVEVTDGTNVYCDDGNGNLFTKANIVSKVTNYENGAVRVTVTTQNAAAYSNVVKYGLAVDKQVKPAGSGINPIYTTDANAQVTLPTNGTTYTISYSYKL